MSTSTLVVFVVVFVFVFGFGYLQSGEFFPEVRDYSSAQSSHVWCLLFPFGEFRTTVSHTASHPTPLPSLLPIPSLCLLIWCWNLFAKQLSLPPPRHKWGYLNFLVFFKNERWYLQLKFPLYCRDYNWRKCSRGRQPQSRFVDTQNTDCTCTLFFLPNVFRIFFWKLIFLIFWTVQFGYNQYELTIKL